MARLMNSAVPRAYAFRETMELLLRETGRKRLLVPIPFPLMMLKATFLGLIPVRRSRAIW